MEIELGLQQEEAIGQAIRTIILTEQGSVPWRPEFGLGASQLLDGGATKQDVVVGIVRQLSDYEKRIQVDKVNVTQEEIGKLTIKIIYTIKETGEQTAYILKN